jgi:hypothetical protein
MLVFIERCPIDPVFLRRHAGLFQDSTGSKMSSKMLNQYRRLFEGSEKDRVFGCHSSEQKIIAAARSFALFERRQRGEDSAGGSMTKYGVNYISVWP